jgi:hypothetical protein
MLHEILISLSGYHSEIWEVLKDDQAQDGTLGTYLSEPEKAMLAVLAQINRLHLEIKAIATKIATNHQSLICRAVGSAIADKHLVDFRKKVFDVESAIVEKDAGYVGGYNIVALSTLVTDFAPWSRRLEWLSVTTRYMSGYREDGKAGTPCTGSQMLDHLQHETHTGYSDIENMAVQLLICAQKVWFRSLASWLLYGKLASSGAEDFFIRANPNDATTQDHYLVQSNSIPTFVSRLAAESVLAVGNALNQISAHGPSGSFTSQNQSLDLLDKHLRLLEKLAFPLTLPLLEAAVMEIDHSISQNALSRLLPLEKVISLLSVIRRFMLLDSGEFAVLLIEHGTLKTANRQSQTSVKAVRKLGRLDDLVMKDVELNSILSKTWDELAAIQIDQGLDMETLSFARKSLSLRGARQQSGEDLVSTWLPNIALLHFNLPPDSTLHLFLTSNAVRVYSLINSYLLSIRRAELQLSTLWKLTSQRRCHPTPLGPPKSATTFGRKMLAARRLREDIRSTKMRQHWSTASRALFFFNVLGDYFHGEIISNSWSQFEHWIKEGVNTSRPGSARPESRPSTANSAKGVLTMNQVSHTFGTPSKVRDPRTLAQGHQSFLSTLRSGLLLDHVEFVSGIRDLLSLIDHYVALFHRIQVVWEGLDMQEDDGIIDAFSDYAVDERDLLGEMVRSRGVLEESLRVLITSLNVVEKENLVNGIISEVTLTDVQRENYVPWNPRKMDRLVMKLESLVRTPDNDGPHEVVGGIEDD